MSSTNLFFQDKDAKEATEIKDYSELTKRFKMNTWVNHIQDAKTGKPISSEPKQHPPLLIKYMNDKLNFGLFAKQRIIKDSFLFQISGSYYGPQSVKKTSEYQIPVPPVDGSKIIENSPALVDPKEVGGPWRFMQSALKKEKLIKCYPGIPQALLEKIATQNVEFRVENDRVTGKTVVNVYAACDIEEGEQICFDYKDEYFFLDNLDYLITTKVGELIDESLLIPNWLHLQAKLNDSEMVFCEIERKKILELAKKNPIVTFGQDNSIMVPSSIIIQEIEKNKHRRLFHSLAGSFKLKKSLTNLTR